MTATAAVLAVGFPVAVADATPATSSCDTTPTLGQYVVCRYADDGNGDGLFTFEVPHHESRDGRLIYATQMIVELRSGGGGGGGASEQPNGEGFNGGIGSNGEAVKARINLPFFEVGTVTVQLGAPGVGGAGNRVGEPASDGGDGGESSLAVSGIASGARIIVANQGRGGGGATTTENGTDGVYREPVGTSSCDESRLDCYLVGQGISETGGMRGWADPFTDEENGVAGVGGLVILTFMYGTAGGAQCGRDRGYLSEDEFLKDIFKGSGTSVDPFLIESEADLLRMSGCSFDGKFVKQTVDIVTTDPAPVKDGGRFFEGNQIDHPIYEDGEYTYLYRGTYGLYPFRGTYDGNNKSIRFDLRTTSCVLNTPHVGCSVFRKTEGAVIKNITVDASNAGGPGIPGTTETYGGWLSSRDRAKDVGDSTPEEFSTFSGITVLGDIDRYSGGIVGSAIDTHVYDSSMTGRLTDNEYNNNFSGGVVGPFSIRATIRRSHSALEPNGHYYAGGIVGAFSVGVTVSEVYSTKDISFGGGGIVGAFASQADISNCFSTGDIPYYEFGYEVGSSVESGGILGTDPIPADSVSHRDPSIPTIIKNCFSTGNFGLGAGGIVGRVTTPNPDGYPDFSGTLVEVHNSYSSGASTSGYLGAIFSGTNYVNVLHGLFIGRYNISETLSLSPSGFNLDRFHASVGATGGAWDNGAYANATWAFCSLVHPTLPYLTAMYTSDPCAVPEPTTTTTTVTTLPTPTTTAPPIPVTNIGVSVTPKITVLRTVVTFIRRSGRMNRAGLLAMSQVIIKSRTLAGPTRTVIGYSSIGSADQLKLDKLRAEKIAYIFRHSRTRGTVEIKALSTAKSRALKPKTLLVTQIG